MWRSIFDSGNAAGQRDTVSDFFRVHGDLLDFSGIDADGNAGNGDTAFTFIGTAEFSAVGQLRYSFVSGQTLIEINTSPSPRSEMQVLLTNGNTALIAADFLL